MPEPTEERMYVESNPWNQSIAEAILEQTGGEHVEETTNQEPQTSGASETQPAETENGVVDGDFVMPEWLSEEYRPTKTDNDTDDVAPYKRAYEKLVGSIQSPEFLDALTQAYTKELSQTDQEIAADRERFLAMRNNPKEFVRIHMPEVAAELGIQLRTTDEMNEVVQAKMSEEFGENWSDMFDPTEQFKLGSTSYNIVQKHQQLIQQVQADQAQAQAKYDQEIKRIQTLKDDPNAKPQTSNLTQQELDSIIEEEYKPFEQAGINKEEYQKFVADLPTKNIGLYEMYLAVNIEKVRQEALEQGRVEGRKGVVGDLKKAGRVKDEVIQKSKEEQKAAPTSSFKDEYYRNQNGFPKW